MGAALLSAQEMVPARGTATIVAVTISILLVFNVARQILDSSVGRPFFDLALLFESGEGVVSLCAFLVHFFVIVVAD